ncbi:hypothetical protein N7456_005672 [Penicillium angulare]|uniref:F-box domain-containing protein n=1 Tax=Penicillium angulare TaxID=116970 RepID=A0A9W9G0J7_9EURO|nr:hypothetical protein N7456_005672 [Penicillium angulare]
MGSWDYYCAFCGSTFSNYHISKRPRTARFLRARRLSAANKQAQSLEEKGESVPDELQKVIQENQVPQESENDEKPERSDDDEGSQSSMDSTEEDYTYDPEIISKEEAAWVEQVQCVGFNPESTALNKIFLSDIGRSDDYGIVEVEGDDPNFPQENPQLSAYWEIGDNPAVYPFHPQCFDIFHFAVAHDIGSKKLAESTDGNWVPQSRNLEKEVVHSTLGAHTEEHASRLLHVEYGDPEPPNDQYWEANPGEELFISNPTQDNELAAGFIAEAWQHARDHVPLHCQPRACTETGTLDPFTKLPFELVLNVVSNLDTPSLMSFTNASAHIYRALDSDNSFWFHHMKSEMPWFFELQRFLENLKSSTCNSNNAVGSNSDMPQERSLRDLFIWADNITTPRKGIRGPLMSIANRRRIWRVCKQLVGPYLAQAESTDKDDESLEANLIREAAVCLHMPAVRDPPQEYHPEKSFWVKCWNDTLCGSTLKIFWNAKKQLVGMGVIIDGDESSELRLFGVEDTRDGSSADSVKIQIGDWISGFILYYPNPNDTPKIRILGITVLLRSGTKMSFGDIGTHNVRRILAARNNMVIVGLSGRIGHLKSSSGDLSNIYHIGLMQCVPGGTQDSREELPEVEILGWANDCTSIFDNKDVLALRNAHTAHPNFTRTASPSGVPIWDIPNLIIQGRHRIDMIGDLVPFEPLIWAKNAGEARALRKLTGYVVDGGLVSGSFGIGTLYDIVGARAEYASESNITKRQISSMSEWETDKCVSLDLDGANGEVVSEVHVQVNWTARLVVKLVTNRGQEVTWGKAPFGESSWLKYGVPPGHGIIGFVTSFTDGRMRSLSVLSIPVA